jgi:hypothetical protein
MRSLAEEQRALQRAILGAEHGARPALAASSRLDVYQHAYHARLAGALRSNYPALAKVMGDEEFDGAARSYARARPSSHYSIRWHGAGLAEHLHGPLADLARMEWALGLAFDARDAEPLTPERLAQVPVERWSTLPLALHPSVSVLELAWAIEPHWQAMRKDADAQTVAPQRRRHVLLAWRKELEACWRSCALQEGQALHALHRRGSLAGACEEAGPEHEEAIGAWFAAWVREGMLVAHATSPE